MGHTVDRLICQRGPVSGSNYEVIPKFTRAKCSEARAKTNTGGGQRIPALQSIRSALSNVARVRWATRIFVVLIL
eukprot:6179288-Pleurochrysis_carterae.AAC.2